MLEAIEFFDGRGQVSLAVGRPSRAGTGVSTHEVLPKVGGKRLNAIPPRTKKGLAR
jgi:hypothetical protein